ncbi:hypothetical protein H4R34_000903 [Dimargaris verticillata]|uniref:Rho-GAP domain-containing protein n=1 Tax=Dimargaris verticillata TaxID=2761393 RepID=A0A9W8B778_9FUNG|nr:hypothetical protein H4R34_000903 [Dimargaris verticillata]
METVQRLIRPTEQCTLCVKVKDADHPGRPRVKLLALAVHQNQGIAEACVFILETKACHSAFVGQVLPLYGDTVLDLAQTSSGWASAKSSAEDDHASGLPVSVPAQLTLQLTNPSGHTVRAVVCDIAELDILVQKLEQAITFAQQQRQFSDGDSHQWTAFYATAAADPHDLGTALDPPDYHYRFGLPTNTDNPLVSLSLLAHDPSPTSPLIEDDNFEGFIFNPASKATKDAWIHGELRAREAQFTDYQSIRMFVGSWNVNGRMATQSLAPWFESMADEDGRLPELLVLGFQELDLRAEAYLVYDGGKEAIWCQAIEHGLGDRATHYHKHVSKQLIGMLIVVYVHTTLADRIQHVMVDSAGCGIMGMIGNKGAVAVRFELDNSSFCVVNCHLAANMNQVDRRNQDFHDICRRVAFVGAADPAGAMTSPPPTVRSPGAPPSQLPSPGLPPPISPSPLPPVLPVNPPLVDPRPAAASPPLDLEPTALTTALSASGLATARSTQAASLEPLTNVRPSGLFDHDYLIWLGDLNYRIPLPPPKIQSLLDSRQYKYLQDFDQLNIQKANRTAFVDFHEHPLDFAPTYKYEVGTNQYDAKRVPAWCDRILWWSRHNSHHVQQRTYHSHMALTSSDHKPISSSFDIWTKAFRRADQAAVYGQIMRELDRYENECMPAARLSETQLDFGSVTYTTPVTRTVTLHNTGKVPVQFRFIPKLDDTDFCRPWLWVNPPTGTVLPGAQMPIYFTIVVGQTNASMLNISQEELRDILILHLQDGKDYFISVQGNYLPTCFGTRLDVLARLPKPIRQMTLEEIQALGDESQYSIPRELWRLVDFIYRHGLQIPNVFHVTGDPTLVAHIQYCLDTGDEFDPALLLDATESHDREAAMPARPDTPDAQSVCSAPDACRTDAARAKLDESTVPGPDCPPPGSPAASVRSEDGCTTKLAHHQAGCHPSHPGQLQPHAGLYAMATALVRFLRQLPEPVIPFNYFDQCVAVGAKLCADRNTATVSPSPSATLDSDSSETLEHTQAFQVVDSLPRPNLNVLVFLLSFLRDFLSHAVDPEIARERMALLMATVMLRPQRCSPDTENLTGAIIQHRKAFMKQLL